MKRFVCNKCDNIISISGNIHSRTQLARDGMKRKGRIYLTTINGAELTCDKCNSTNIYPEDTEEVVLK
jgi:RNase P subunit RPR2